MNRKMLPVVFPLVLCPLLYAQQPTQAASTGAAAQPAQAIQITGSLQLTHAAQVPVEEHLLTAADLDRDQILKKARTVCIFSNTDFLSSATLSRALLNNKDWEKLGLSIVDGPRYFNPSVSKPRPAELQLQIDRVVFTHIHTYVLTERATGVVLASGRVRAIDGIVASGPMAEQIVKILSAARLQAPPKRGNSGF
ncbi:MAG: hypothetical protein ABSC77_11285 [Terracidiphilus sp.]|jgi:hypothetical protein